VFGTTGTFPTSSFNESNYFRDVVFVADAASIGAEDDFYIDTTDWDVYGPKAAGAWGDATSLRGADAAPAARNLLINGDMRLDQRNAGASASITGQVYTLDRWRAVRGGNGTLATMSVQRVTSNAHPEFQYSVLVTFSSAATLGTTSQHALLQFVEGLNVGDLKWGSADAKTVTLSFWVRASVTGTYPVAVFNSSAARSYAGQYVVNAANTWEYKTVVIPGDTTGTWLTDTGKGLALYFGLGEGTAFNSSSVNTWQGGTLVRASGHVTPATTNGATWQITGVQLERGSEATPFEHLPIGELLRRCQRYYVKSFPLETAPAQNAAGGNYYYFSQNVAAAVQTYANTFPFPVRMRAAPTATLYNPSAANAHARNFNRTNDSTSTAAGTSEIGMHLQYNTSTGSAAGDVYFINFSADAEL
jgi:hypothetical protein